MATREHMQRMLTHLEGTIMLPAPKNMYLITPYAWSDHGCDATDTHNATALVEEGQGDIIEATDKAEAFRLWDEKGRWPIGTDKFPGLDDVAIFTVSICTVGFQRKEDEHEHLKDGDAAVIIMDKAQRFKL